MILSQKEISFLKENREIIKEILEKRQKDILDVLIDTEEENKKIGLQYLARQFKEGLGILENIMKLKQKKRKSRQTGI